MSAEPEPTFRIDEAREVLRGTPSALSALLAGLGPAWLEADEGPGTWSPKIVLGHLIHAERTDWIPRAKHILQLGESVPFAPFDRSAEVATSTKASIDDLLAAFATERARSLDALDDLHLVESDWERRGRHPALGTVTLRELIATWVAHDLGHAAQVARVMAKRYTRDVGPWRAYLPVLSERTSGPAT